MSKPLRVNRYSTYLTIKSTKEGLNEESGFDLHKTLTLLKIPLFNAAGTYIGSVKYYRFIKDSFHLPLHVLPYLLEDAKRQEIEVDVHNCPVNPAGHINLSMKLNWTDRPEHEEAFNHLTSYEGSMVGNNLQTGKGKSYIGVKLSTIWKTPTLVVCDGLVEQWVDNYLEKTKVNPDDIFVLQGHTSLDKLWAMINDKKRLPWIVVVSLKTLTRYSQYKDANYNKYPRINDLMRELQIGYAIFDEVHLNTHAITMLLLVLNIQHNVFLSATPERSKKEEQRIFKVIFPEGMIAGSATYDRYVRSVIRGYDLDMQLPSQKFESFGYGYSHIKYESKVLAKGSLMTEFTNIVDKNLEREYLYRDFQDGNKCLIFVSTVKMAVELAARLKIKHPNMDIRTYTASDPLENLTEADIIVSTPKSCGVGKDIKGLVTIINTVSIASKPALQQMFGRLRKLEGKECVFVDLFNTSVRHQVRHFWNKRGVLKACSRSMTQDGVAHLYSNNRGGGNERPIDRTVSNQKARYRQFYSSRSKY